MQLWNEMEAWLEHNFRVTEAFDVDSDDLTVKEPVGPRGTILPQTGAFLAPTVMISLFGSP